MGTINATSLYVNGAPYIGSQWTTNSNSTAISITSSNVGIGKTNPGVPLDVVGAITSTGTVTASALTASNVTATTSFTEAGALLSSKYALSNTLSNYVLTATANTNYAPSNALGSYVLTTAGNTNYAPSNTLSNYVLTSTANTNYAPSNALGSYVLTTVGNANYAPSNTLSNYVLTSAANTNYAPSNALGSYVLTTAGNTNYAPSNTLSNYVLTSTANTNYAPSNALGSYVLTTAGNTNYAPSNTLSNYVLTSAANTNYAPSNTTSAISTTATAASNAAYTDRYWTISTSNVYTNSNVGIGKNNPSYTLDVNGTINATSVLVNGSAITASGGSAGFWSSNSSNMFTLSNVGIGKSNPSYTLDVNGTINATTVLMNGSAITGGSGGSAGFWSSNSSNMFTYCNVGIGTSNPSYPLHVVGSIFSTADVFAFSDARYKTDLQGIQNAVGKLKTLAGYTYKIDDDEHRHTGLLAQDVEAVLPEAVSMASDGRLALAYGNLAGLFVEAFKEIDARLSAIESHIGI
jgi:hypothetical protein